MAEQDDLDYGPAPGSGEERIKGGFQDWARRHNPDYQPMGDPGPNPFNPENKPLDMDPRYAKEWAAEDTAAGFAPTDTSLQSVLAPNQLPPKTIDPANPSGTPKEFVQHLVLERNVPFGEALGILETLYQEGDPYVRSLYDIDEVMSRLPSSTERAKDKFLSSVMSPIAAAADLVGSQLPGFDPKGPLSHREALRIYEKTPPSTLGTLAGAAGTLATFQGAAGPISGALTAGLLRLPKYKEAAAMIAEVATRGRLGKAITSANLPGAAQDQLAKAVTRGNAIGTAAAALGISALEGNDGGELATAAAAMAGGSVLGKVLLKIPTINKFFGTKGYNEAMRWISQRSGLPIPELTRRITTFDAMYNMLHDTDASLAVRSAFFDGVAGSTGWNRELGTHFGVWAAGKRLAPELLEVQTSIMPKQMGQAARKAYQTVTDRLIDSEGVVARQAEKAVRGGFQRLDVAQKAAAKASAFKMEGVKVKVVAQPVMSAGTRMYFSPKSRFATKLGQEVTREQTFFRPLKVTYNPAKETAAEAVIRSIQTEKGKPDVGRVALYMLNKYAQRGASNYNDIAKEFAYRLAKRAGYESIAARSSGSAADDLFIDLLGYRPKTDLAAYVDELEQKIVSSYTSKMNYAPLIPITVASAAGLGALLAPTEAEAINWKQLGDIVRGIAKSKTGSEMSPVHTMHLLDYLGQNVEQPQFKATKWGLDRLETLRIFDDVDYNDADSVVQGLRRIHETVQARPEKLEIDYVGNKLGRWLELDELGMADSITIRFYHPDVISDKSGEQALLGELVGYIRPNAAGKRILGNIALDSYGPGVVGPMKVGRILAEAKKVYKIDDIIDHSRVTGTAAAIGGRTARFNLARLSAIPITIGAASLFAPQGAEASLIDPKKLSKLVVDFSDKIGTTPTNPLWDFIEGVAEKYPATSKVLMGIAERMGLEGRISKTELLRDYAKVRNDLRTKPLDIVDEEAYYAMDRTLLQRPTAIPIENAGHLMFDVEHPLTAEGTLARIEGYIDPASKEWLLDVVGAKRAGLGMAALGSMVAHAKSTGRISGIKGKLTKLAVIAAATGAASAMDWAWPEDSQAAPIGKWLSKGIKGVSDDVIGAMAKSNTPEELLAAMNVARGVTKAALGKVDDLGVGERIAAAGLTDPAQAFDPTMSRLFGSEPTLKPGAYWWRLPIDAIDDPGADVFITQMIDKEGKILSNKGSAMRESLGLADSILDEAKLERKDFDQLHVAVQGLVRDGSGALNQTAKGITPAIDKAARRLREEIFDELYKSVTGIDAKAPAILRELNLEETEDTWRLMKYLQGHDFTTGVPKWQGRLVREAEMIAAERTRGMVNPAPWHTLNTKFIEGYMTQMPIAGEKAKLLDEVQRIRELHPSNLTPQELKYEETIKARLAYLADVERQIATRRSIPTNILAKSHFYGPISQAEEINLPEIIREKDPKKLLHPYIKGLYGKLFYDEQLYFARGLASMYEQMGGINGPQSATWIRELMNVSRGIRSINEDSRIAALFDYYKKYDKTGKLVRSDPTTVQKVRDFASKLMQFQYITKLGMSVKYPIVNMSQTMLTTAPITGYSNVIAAMAKIASNPREAYKEAIEAGLLKGESVFLQELEGVGFVSAAGKRIAKVADWAPSKSEDLNRVISFHAAKLQALQKIARGKFKVPTYVRYFDHTVLESADPEKIAIEYAKAVTRTTQFVFGPLGRPLAFSGGAARRVIGQFKTFQAGYISLLGGTFRHMVETKDPLPFLQMAASLTMLGGVGAVVGERLGTSLVESLRGFAVKAGLDPDIVPRGSIFGAAAQIAGFNTGVDLGQSVSPINLPNPATQPESLLGYAAGPTLGSGIEMATGAYKYATGDIGSSEAVNKMLRPLLPIAVSGLEAMQEAGIGREFFDKFNYRGGIYSNSGEPLVEGRPMRQIIQRGLGLQPSVRTQRNRYLRDIERAMEAEDVERVQELVLEATDRGFVINKRALSSLKSRITRRRNREERPNQ